MKTIKCFLKYPIEKLKGQCCCNCKHQKPTTVCNCFGQWPDEIIKNRSKFNKNHGNIGYACLGFHFCEDGPIEIMKGKHGTCEMWEKK